MARGGDTTLTNSYFGTIFARMQLPCDAIAIHSIMTKKVDTLPSRKLRDTKAKHLPHDELKDLHIGEVLTEQ